MINNPYDKDLDKITEAEVVYDFVERLNLGKDLELPYGSKDQKKIIFKAKTLLLDILKFILSLLPPSIVFDRENISTCVIKLPVGTSTAACSFDGNVSIYRAYSDRSGLDVSSCFTVAYSSSTNKTTCTFKTDVGYPYMDYLSVYAKKVS